MARMDRSGVDPGDAQAVSEERFAQLERDAAGAHDINARTHVGYYPQRPGLSVNQTASAGSYEELAESLPDGPENELSQDAEGNWVRHVSVVVDQVRDEKGVVYNRVEDVPRFVALTQEAARGASADGRETDWWNGFTWMRRGYKPEKDFQVVQQRNVRLVRADAATQAMMDQSDLKRAAAAPLIPRASADDLKASDGGKKE